MTIEASDISIVLSGGLSNIDPNHSLGGDPSVYPITSNINNLFADVTADQSLNGYVDYRCVYIVNNNATDSLYNVTCSLTSQVTGGSSISMGVLARNEVQNLFISGTPTGGYIVIKYENALSPHIAWNSTPSVFVINLQNGLNATAGLSQVVCSQGATSSQFVITFTGDDGDRNQNLLVLQTNALTPTVPNPIFTTTIDGGPRNDIAGSISSPTIVPNGVVFSVEPVIINTLRAEEICPIWFQRTTAIGTSALADDGFSLRIQGTPFP